MSHSKGGIVKGRICFMVLSVMVAVSTGFAYDISAYSYESPLQKAYMESEQSAVEETLIVENAIQSVQPEHIEEASAELDELITAQKEAEEAAARAQKSNFEFSKGNNVSVNPSERDILSMIVMAEAGGEDLQGQIMVANVVLNRVKAGYGNSITEVVLAPGQFDPASSGTLWSMVPSASVYEAVDRALAGEDYSEGALYFVSGSCDYSWFMEALTFIGQHGGHLFFR